ncbi:unnamed protein product [Parnassius mnemosyne]
MVAARTAAGLGAAGAWALAPLLANEMCSAAWRGAAAAAVVPAHNLGVLLMYLAADARLPHATVLWWCLGLSVSHCFVFMLMPESPAFLAASGKLETAEQSLRWLRGSPGAGEAGSGAGNAAGSGAGTASLKNELAALPAPDLLTRSAFALAKDMLSDKRRRRAFFIGGMAVVGQEACGVLALLQYAERVFVLAEGGEAGGEARAAGDAVLMSPARHAVILGVVQLAASFIALYLVERVGRRPLIVWSALCTGAFLAAGAVLVAWPRLRVGGARAAGLALAAAVAADSAGLQPAPYALLADMFHYEFRSCALLLVTAAAGAGNALEVCVFPLVARGGGGLRAAIALAAAITLAYAAFAFAALPETRRRTPQQIYDALEYDTPACRFVTLFKRFTKRITNDSSCPEKGKSETNKSEKPTIHKQNRNLNLYAPEQNRVNSELANKSDVTLHTNTNNETENTNM